MTTLLAKTGTIQKVPAYAVCSARRDGAVQCEMLVARSILTRRSTYANAEPLARLQGGGGGRATPVLYK